MSKGVLCPVCNGVGKVSAGFYNRAGNYPLWVTGTNDDEVCRSCNGKGWVEVSNADDRLESVKNISYSRPPDYNKCPSCGGDRNSPAGTGCPMGSHYGSYCEAVS